MSAPSAHIRPAALPERSSREIGIRLMLAVVVFFLAISDMLNMPFSLAPGLSAKNALLYLLAVGLVAKFAVQGKFRLEVPGILTCFAVLVGYAIATMLNAALIVEYPRYDLLYSTIRLKAILGDQLMFFAVFFYALHSRANALTMIRVLLFAVVLANGLAVLGALGVIDIGELTSYTGRMEGVMGEANQYGAFIVLFLPALLNEAMTARALMRIVWIAGVFVSMLALIMTISRGAFLAIAVASVWSGYMFRRFISVRKAASMIGIGALIAAVAVVAISARYGGLLYERLFVQSGGALSEMSSGRSEVWTEIVTRMFETPVTLLMGFGWDVYATMPFRYSAHNHYLSLWFNLGLPGLLAGTLLLVQVARRARAAAYVAADPYRWFLISFVVGTVALAIAAFFVELYAPWIWFWIYAGLALRIALNTEARAAAAMVRRVAPVQKERADPHGWRGRAPTAKTLQ